MNGSSTGFSTDLSGLAVGVYGPSIDVPPRAARRSASRPSASSSTLSSQRCGQHREHAQPADDGQRGSQDRRRSERALPRGHRAGQQQQSTISFQREDVAITLKVTADQRVQLRHAPGFPGGPGNRDGYVQPRPVDQRRAHDIEALRGEHGGEGQPDDRPGRAHRRDRLRGRDQGHPAARSTDARPTCSSSCRTSSASRRTSRRSTA